MPDGRWPMSHKGKLQRFSHEIILRNQGGRLPLLEDPVTRQVVNVNAEKYKKSNKV